MKFQKNNIDGNFVWVDLEMTGLNPEQDVILEIATIVTDNQLNIIDQTQNIVIAQPASALQNMNIEVAHMHTKSGLSDLVKESATSLAQALEQTMQVIKKHCNPQTAYLAGNSVWKDRHFLYKYMPELVEYLHYRIIDVSTIKQLVLAWYKENPDANFVKKETHRALDDIQESIAELQYWRKHFFV